MRCRNACRAQEWRLPGALRRGLILATPFVLALYEIGPPRPEENAGAVVDVAGSFALLDADRPARGHPYPFGTVAFGAVFLVALWLDRRGYRDKTAEPNATENARHQITTVS